MLTVRAIFQEASPGSWTRDFETAKVWHHNVDTDYPLSKQSHELRPVEKKLEHFSCYSKMHSLILSELKKFYHLIVKWLFLVHSANFFMRGLFGILSKELKKISETTTTTTHFDMTVDGELN